MGEVRKFESRWFATAKDKRVARALGIEVDDLPEWLGKAYRRLSLREVAATISAHGESVSLEWVRGRLIQFGIPTRRETSEASA